VLVELFELAPGESEDEPGDDSVGLVLLQLVVAFS
jgi:hypothetical protein